MPGKFVQDKAHEHGLFLQNELQMPKQFVEDKAPEHGLFLEGKLNS
jgi:hypothetical protein